MIPIVAVDSVQGHLFRALNREALCFVPREYLREADGQLALNELGYVQERWSVRNMRWAYNEPGGAHLFPDLAQPITDLNDPAVVEFIGRASSRSRHPFGELASG